MGTPPRTRLTFGRDATPVALVTAVPTRVPSSVKVMLRPATAAPLKVLFSVVESVAVPKYAPVELATIKLVADSGAETVTAVVAELLAGFVSTAEELLAFEVLLMVSPFRSVATVDVTMVAVPDWPLPSEANVIVRLRPAPLS